MQHASNSDPHNYKKNCMQHASNSDPHNCIIMPKWCCNAKK